MFWKKAKIGSGKSKKKKKKKANKSAVFGVRGKREKLVGKKKNKKKYKWVHLMFDESPIHVVYGNNASLFYLIVLSFLLLCGGVGGGFGPARGPVP